MAKGTKIERINSQRRKDRPKKVPKSHFAPTYRHRIRRRNSQRHNNLISCIKTKTAQQKDINSIRKESVIMSANRHKGRRASDQSDRTDRHRLRRLRPSGGYRQLRSFQTATLIYDGTVSFCERFVNPRSRPMTKWYRQRGAGGRTSLRAAAQARPAASRKHI